MALRILSYNILFGGEERLPHIANVIRQQQPDAVALLEANDSRNAQTLAEQLEMQLSFGTANNEFHVAWLSRLPLVRTQNHRLAVLSKTLLEIEVEWGGAPVALFATHLHPGRNQESDHHRAAEVQAILSILQQRGSQPHLLVGDFNSLRPGDPIDVASYLSASAEEGEEQMREDQFSREVIPLLLQAGYTDCYRAKHPDTAGYTYKLPTPSLRLDYLFASPALATRLSASDVVTTDEARIASDHLPVWAEFR